MPAVKPPYPRLQRGHPLARGLVLGLPLYEGSGLTTNDLSGSGLGGTLTGGPTWQAGQAGWCLEAAGTSDYVTCPTPNAALAAAAPAVTVACWVNLATNGQYAYYVACYNGSTLGKNGYVGFTLWAYDNAKFTIGNGTGVPTDCVGATNLASFYGKWTHLCGTYDGVTQCVYVDGVLDASNAPAANGAISYNGLYSTVDNVRVGSYSFAGGSLIDGVSVHGYAMTASGVAALYADSWAMYRRPSWRLKSAAAPTFAGEEEGCSVITRFW